MGTPYILFLPDVALEKIFSFLSFDEIAKNRLVCRKFNETGGKMLSRGFIQLEKRHTAIYKRVKSLLPRRESERRAHPLSRHCDILQAVETRISMLNMTYIKYIENNLLCFIPGKVLDEMRNVLCLVETDGTPPRTHQLLQELRDLSSMAMEHFDEHILPRVKEQVEKKTSKMQSSQSRHFYIENFPALSYGGSPSTSKSPRIFFAQQHFSNELHKVKKQNKTHKHHITFLTQNTQKLYQKMRKQTLRLKAQSVKIREQERKIQEQAGKIQEQEATIADIKKHMDEWDQKYMDLTTELVRARDDILLKAAAAHKPLSPPPKFYKSNIKPRSAHILPKNYVHLELDRKRKSNLLPEIPVKLRCHENEELTKNKEQDLISFKDKDRDNPENKESLLSKADLGTIASTLENFLKNSLNSIKSRKRKMSEDIDLK